MNRTHTLSGSRDAGFGIKPLTQRGTLQNQSELVSVLGRQESIEAWEKRCLGLADRMLRKSNTLNPSAVGLVGDRFRSKN